MLGIDQVFLERFEGVVIELQPEFEDAIGEALVLLEERNDLLEDGVIVHHRPSTCASAASACGSQEAISIARYNSTAVDNSRCACSCWPIFAYKVPSPRWQWATSGRMPCASARARA